MKPSSLEEIESGVNSVTSGNHYIKTRTSISIWNTKPDELQLFTASNPSKQPDSVSQKSCLFLWILCLPSVHPLERNVEARIL